MTIIGALLGMAMPLGALMPVGVFAESGARVWPLAPTGASVIVLAKGAPLRSVGLPLRIGRRDGGRVRSVELILVLGVTLAFAEGESLDVWPILFTGDCVTSVIFMLTKDGLAPVLGESLGRALPDGEVGVDSETVDGVNKLAVVLGEPVGTFLGTLLGMATLLGASIPEAGASVILIVLGMTLTLATGESLRMVGLMLRFGRSVGGRVRSAAPILELGVPFGFSKGELVS